MSARGDGAWSVSRQGQGLLRSGRRSTGAWAGIAAIRPPPAVAMLGRAATPLSPGSLKRRVEAGERRGGGCKYRWLGRQFRCRNYFGLYLVRLVGWSEKRMLGHGRSRAFTAAELWADRADQLELTLKFAVIRGESQV